MTQSRSEGHSCPSLLVLNTRPEILVLANVAAAVLGPLVATKAKALGQAGKLDEMDDAYLDCVRLSVMLAAEILTECEEMIGRSLEGRDEQ